MRITKLLAGLIFMSLSLGTNGDVAVITHIDNPLHTLTPANIKRIFLKQTLEFSDGNTVVVRTLPLDLHVTRAFYQAALEMNGNQWRTYWAQYEFSGQKLPPQELGDQETMRQWVAQTPGALGFIHVDWVDDSVKVLRALDIDSGECEKEPDCD